MDGSTYFLPLSATVCSENGVFALVFLLLFITTTNNFALTAILPMPSSITSIQAFVLKLILWQNLKLNLSPISFLMICNFHFMKWKLSQRIVMIINPWVQIKNFYLFFETHQIYWLQLLSNYSHVYQMFEHGLMLGTFCTKHHCIKRPWIFHWGPSPNRNSFQTLTHS